jgi:DNA invertase Pin-like site-specific DNA recombinase
LPLASRSSLADTWADTTTPHGRLILTLLGGLAEFERELIKARSGEGRTRAKARGVHMGPLLSSRCISAAVRGGHEQIFGAEQQVSGQRANARLPVMTAALRFCCP